MSIEIKGTKNYSATVIRVPELRKAENSDKLYIIDKLGMTSIVDESWKDKVGELALLFPAEVQLSEEFTRSNNLYRHSEKNADRSKTGYLDDNRRVRALKLRGNISNGLALPLDSLGPVMDKVDLYWSRDVFEEGMVFDTFGGHQICRKYVIEEKAAALTKGERQVKKAFKRVDSTFLPEHFETGQWMRERDSVPNDAELIITQKLHGTSVRLANTVVKRQLNWLEKIAQKLGVAVKDHDYDLVAGSRRAIKDPNNPNQAHFYKEDIWTDALRVYGDQLPKNFVVYGELVGFVPNTGTPIQEGHTYEDVPGDYSLYVYRVAIITEDAELVDLSWDQVKGFCERHGFTTVPELDRIPKMAFDIEEYNEQNFYMGWLQYGEGIYNERPVPISEGGTGKDEGIAIRVETKTGPELYKFKNKSHYLYESNQLDTGEADLESQG